MIKGGTNNQTPRSPTNELGETVEPGQHIAARILCRKAQRCGHQARRIEAQLGIFA